MSKDEKPYYPGFFELIQELRTTDPTTAHPVLDWVVFKDFDEKRQPEHWLANAWNHFPNSDDVQKRAEFARKEQFDPDLMLHFTNYFKLQRRHCRWRDFPGEVR